MTEERTGEVRIEPRGSPSSQVTDALELLAAPRRRCTLEYLHDTTDEAVGLDELAAHVWERERNAGDDDRTAAARDVYNDLYHAHIPHLCAADVAAYDAESDSVRLEAVPKTLERLLALAGELDGRDGQR